MPGGRFRIPSNQFPAAKTLATPSIHSPAHTGSTFAWRVDSDPDCVCLPVDLPSKTSFQRANQLAQREVHRLLTVRVRGCLLPEPAASDSAEREAKTAKMVMDYFAQRARAMDTLAGIMDWWLPQDIDLETMQRVLDRLTEQGSLERIGSGEHAHYRLKSS